jgi:hypothetical protein
LTAFVVVILAALALEAMFALSASAAWMDPGI